MAEAKTTQGKLRKVSHKEDHFCLLYVTNGLNGADAAKGAGWAPKTAHVTASKLLTKPNIQARIKELAKEILDKQEVSADRVISELARLAFSDITSVVEWNKDGAAIMHSSSEMPEDVSRTIESIEITEDMLGTDESTRMVQKTKVKLHSKVKALEMLGKYLKLFADKTDINVTGPVKINIVKYDKGEDGN